MKHLLLIIKNHAALVRSVYIMALVVIVPLLLTPWLTNHEPPLVAQPIILVLAVAAFLTVWKIREAQRVRLSNPLRKHYIDSFIPGVGGVVDRQPQLDGAADRVRYEVRDRGRGDGRVRHGSCGGKVEIRHLHLVTAGSFYVCSHAAPTVGVYMLW